MAVPENWRRCFLLLICPGSDQKRLMYLIPTLSMNTICLGLIFRILICNSLFTVEFNRKTFLFMNTLLSLPAMRMAFTLRLRM